MLNNKQNVMNRSLTNTYPSNLQKNIKCKMFPLKNIFLSRGPVGIVKFYYPRTVGPHCSYTYMCPKGFRLNPDCDMGFCNYTKWIQLHMTMKPSCRSTFKNVYECVNDS